MNRNDYFIKDIEFLTKYSHAHQIVYSINVSLKYKYIFLETPKSGCSSIKRFLIKNESEHLRIPDEGLSPQEQFNFLHNRDFSPLLNPKQLYPFKNLLERQDFFKFCFVRNPYERLLSAYLDKIVNNRQQSGNIKMALGLPPSRKAEILFKQFIDVVCATPIFSMDPHWKIQYYHNCMEDIDYDFVGRFENFDSDIQHVCSKTGLQYDLYTNYAPHRKNSGSVINQYYDQELRDKVFEKYRIDFEYFGYAK